MALAPSMQENYENISQLWSELKINNSDETIITDLKFAKIMHSRNYVVF